ncbi:hypothetical protein HPG69_003196 [Diceros bicornis minor]|uniref:Uncharacterized protein n=1 Tax=Diceros bicornis minor TaxID=77932 RepID=A0A7J7EJZ0_DICBM|nr:hypothetical protein HPG69_003196 [Diceros bicornis minor]
MGPQGIPVIPERHQPTGTVKAATTGFNDRANSGLRPQEMEGNYIPKPHILFPHLLPRKSLHNLLPSSSLDGVEAFVSLDSTIPQTMESWGLPGPLDTKPAVPSQSPSDCSSWIDHQEALSHDSVFPAPWTVIYVSVFKKKPSRLLTAT